MELPTAAQLFLTIVLFCRKQQRGPALISLATIIVSALLYSGPISPQIEDTSALLFGVFGPIVSATSCDLIPQFGENDTYSWDWYRVAEEQGAKAVIRCNAFCPKCSPHDDIVRVDAVMEPKQFAKALPTFCVLPRIEILFDCFASDRACAGVE